jgi:DNA-binding NarL/FixJ family response regulator
VLELREQHPDLKVLIFSQYIETRYATRLLAHSSAGVGYLLNSFVGSQLLVGSIYRTAHRRRRLTAMSLQEVRHHG